MTRSEIITKLDSADLFLRNRAKAKKAPLTQDDVLLFLDMEQMCHGATVVISSLTEEIERYKGVIRLLENDVQTAKSEARKEFAEELKKERCKHRNLGEFIFFDDIDRVLMGLESETK